MLRRWLKSMVLMVLLWISGFFWFCFSLPQQSLCKTCNTDAIVVLTGGYGRISYALSLLNKGLSDILFISGVNPETTKSALIKASGYQEVVPLEKIILDYQSKTTQQNAFQVKHWVEKNCIKTIRLVTADYHMHRARFELQIVAPELKVVYDPVNSIPERGQRGYKMFIMYYNEYNKYLGALIRHGLQAIHMRVQNL